MAGPIVDCNQRNKRVRIRIRMRWKHFRQALKPPGRRNNGTLLGDLRVLAVAMGRLFRIPSRIAFLFLAMFLLAGQSVSLFAMQEMSCDLCHEDVSVSNTVHEFLDCTNCHSNAEEVAHAENLLARWNSPEICRQCHEAVAEDLSGGIHSEILDCRDCHGPAHSILPSTDLSSTVSPVKQIQVCSECHDTDDLIGGYLQSVHGRALLVSGLINAPSCSDCHGSHAILPVRDLEATVSEKRIPETCGSCHRYILDTWVTGSAHGRFWAEGKPSPVCSTCHSSHQVLRPAGSDQRLKFPENCGGCHENRYESYRDGFHGQVTDLGYMTAAICSDCHSPHQNLPASDPDSTVHPDHLAETCGTCHQQVGSGFLTYDPHSEPSNPNQNPFLYWMWFFMTGLLISVFGFFGVHTAVVLQRSVVGLLRGEVPVLHGHDGPYIRRFSRSEIGIHVTIVLSFLLLAATGLPLKFHATQWARALADLLGGVGTTRFLHRVAAVVTFGYAFYHLTTLFRRIVWEKDYGLLWGWRSMVPGPRDFTDLWQNMRYCLYMGRRPSFDRWTYWEKFDYFAVFWGVVIIGLSGLVLWFPAFFTRFLPGWFLNVAHVVHSDEALLATGFIFVFHFFNTHLRPESFPLDPVIFTGKMSLAKFKEERPEEYRRLVQRGEMEQYLTDPPTPAELRRARIFGFAAVAVGLALVAGIVAGFLAGR